MLADRETRIAVAGPIEQFQYGDGFVTGLGSKHFFFEKKKQKTFMTLSPAHPVESAPFENEPLRR
jgi:hypothetical protein